MSNVSHPLVWKILAREKVIFPQQVSLQSKVESEILCSDNTVVISGVHLRDKDYFDPHHILGFKGTHPQSARQGTCPKSRREHVKLAEARPFWPSSLMLPIATTVPHILCQDLAARNRSKPTAAANSQVRFLRSWMARVRHDIQWQHSDAAKLLWQRLLIMHVTRFGSHQNVHYAAKALCSAMNHYQKPVLHWITATRLFASFLLFFYYEPNHTPSGMWWLECRWTN